MIDDDDDTPGTNGWGFSDGAQIRARLIRSGHLVPLADRLAREAAHDRPFLPMKGDPR